jgi:serine/threonine-protein kinase
MGQIYLAASGEVEGAEKLCVVKKLLEESATTSTAARFLDEMRVVVRLNHGNLVQVFDAGQVTGELYLAMELVEGRDLRAIWNRLQERGRRVPAPVALHVAREICRGLSYAHGYGGLNLVHRDIAPPNVLLSWHGEVKVTDFGLAASKLKSEHTAPGIVFGRMAYLSPEQARGEEADVRSDVWAVGVILWELLAGRPLHLPQTDQKAMLAQVRAPKIDPPSAHVPGLPPSLDEVVTRALAVNRLERWQTAEELREAVSVELGALAPSTDGAAVATLLRELWGDEIEKEQQEQERLLREELPKLVKRESTRPIAGARRDSSPSGAFSKTALAPSTRTPAPPPRTPAPPSRSASASSSGIPRVRASIDQTEKRVSANSGGAGPPPLPPRSGSRPGVRSSVPVRPAPVALMAPEEDQEPDANAYLGQIIDQRYRVERVLGQGGMGWVYEVEHIEIGKKLALKVLLPQFSRQADLVARFRREARAASTIGHPNIVDVTDSGTTEDGSFYFVMERLEGIELGDALRNDRRLPSDRAVHIAVQMCRALAAAHAAGIIHRDLKPENVFLVTRDGDADFVKILDFGIAKAPEVQQTPRKLTTPGIAMGTPEYMAPEQAAGRAADPRADVYSVGAILYEMVTGWPPHSGENVMEILTKKATEAVRPARELNPEVPEALERVIAACLERDVALRPQSMSALEYQLTKSARGRGLAVAALLGLKGDHSDPNNLWGTPRERMLTPPVMPRVGMTPPVVPRVATPVPPSSQEMMLPPPVSTAPIAIDLEERSTAPRPAMLEPKPKGSRVPIIVGALIVVAGAAVGVAKWQPWKATPVAGVATNKPVSPVTPVPVEPPPTVDPNPPPVEPKHEDIAALLEWARRAADGNRLIKPPGDNMKELLERIEASDPGNATAAALRAKTTATVRTRANLELRKKKLNEAEDDYRALIELDPADTSSKPKLAATLALRANLDLSKNKVIAALADAQAAVEILPDDPSLRMVLADAFMANNKREQAADEYKLIIEAQPGNAKAQKKLAFALKPVPGKKKKKGR